MKKRNKILCALLTCGLVLSGLLIGWGVKAQINKMLLKKEATESVSEGTDATTEEDVESVSEGTDATLQSQIKKLRQEEDFESAEADDPTTATTWSIYEKDWVGDSFGSTDIEINMGSPNKSLKGAANGNGDTYSPTNIQLVSGKTYEISFWYKVTMSDKSEDAFYFTVCGDEEESFGDTNWTWKQFTKVYEPTSNGSIEFAANDLPAGSYTIYLDDIVVQELLVKVEGATVATSGEADIRFEAKLTETVNEYKEDVKEVGVLLIPTDLLNNEELKDDTANSAIKTVPYNKFEVGKSFYVNLLKSSSDDKYLNRQYTVRAFVKLNDDTVLYSNMWSRSCVDVAKALAKKYDILIDDTTGAWSVDKYKPVIKECVDKMLEAN